MLPPDNNQVKVGDCLWSPLVDKLVWNPVDMYRQQHNLPDQAPVGLPAVDAPKMDELSTAHHQSTFSSGKVLFSV